VRPLKGKKAALRSLNLCVLKSKMNAPESFEPFLLLDGEKK